MVQFNTEQLQALDSVARWYKERREPYFYLAGYAGTGKTELARHFASGIKEVRFAAFTGKAASVLKERGCEGAQTIHSLIYSPSAKSDSKLKRMVAKLDDLKKNGANPAEMQDVLDDIEEEQKRIDDPDFDIKEETGAEGASLIILDECSMIDNRMAEDLMSFGVPILFLGDPAQLPPVKGAGYFQRKKPDALLTEVHRHDGHILDWATIVRNGGTIPICDLGDARKMRIEDLTIDDLCLADQVLTGQNSTRRKMNVKIRKHLGFSSWYPQVDDRLICLRNDKDIGVLNGVQCTATSDSIAFGADIMLNINYEGRPLNRMPVLRNHFEEYKGKAEYMSYFQRQRALEFDFGYALTVHKAQGSQWDNVYICVDGFVKRNPKGFAQWMYTALTRAQSKVTVIV